VLAASGNDLDMVACGGDASLGTANFDEQIALALDKGSRADGAVLRRRIGEAALLRTQLEDATLKEGIIESRWPGCRVAIVHRVGTLLPGESAVVIAVSAPHRAAAFEGCRHAIERLKADVPIWKKERFEDGEEWVGLGP
jgi:hypothetical protein